MNRDWDKIKTNFAGLRGLSTIGLSDIIGNAASAVFWFYMATLLQAENYGYISYVLALGGLASTISLSGSSIMLSTYVPKNVKIEGPMFVISLSIVTISSIVLFAMYKNPYLIVWLVGAVIYGLGGSEIMAKKLYTNYAKYLVAQRLLMMGLAVLFYYLIGKEGVILGIGLGYLPYAVRIYKVFSESKINLKIIREYHRPLLYNSMINFSVASIASIDKLVIGPILGLAVLGNYQLGLQLLAILEMLPSIVFRYTLPHDASGNPNIKLKKLTIIAAIALAIIGYIVSPLVIPVIFPKFEHAIEIFQILSISIVPTTFSTLYMSKLLGNEKTFLVFIASIIFLSTQIVSIIVLGKMIGVNGIAIAYVLSACIQAVFLYGVNRFMLEKTS